MHAHVTHVRPTTPLGRWAAWLALGFVVLNFAWMILPGGAMLAFLSGIAGGIAALVAIRRRGERGLLVYAAIIPLLAVVAFVLAELLIGHE
jgi:hypothetical protein